MGKTSRVSLREYYTRDFLPTFLVGSSPRTIAEYEATLNAWERLSVNPPIDKIDTAELARFKTSALSTTDEESDALSPATVNKHLRHLHHMLSKAGPPGWRNKDALGLLKRAPWTKPLPEFEPEPRIITDDELAAWFKATTLARLPRLDGVTPGQWWRAYASGYFMLMTRRGVLLQLRVDQVSLDDLLLRYGGSIDKRKRARAKPIHPTLAEHLRPMVAAAIAAGRTNVYTWPHSPRAFYKEFRRLQDLAGQSKNRWRLHDLKKTAATAGTETMDVFALKEFCDHASIKTTEKYYATAAKRMRPAVNALKVPSAFTQLSLFTEDPPCNSKPQSTSSQAASPRSQSAGKQSKSPLTKSSAIKPR